MKIEKSILNEWLETALPMFEPIETADQKCIHCGDYMSFPIMARQEHVEAFEQLLEIAHKYLEGEGVQEKMMQSILDQLIAAKTKRHLTLIKGGKVD